MSVIRTLGTRKTGMTRDELLATLGESTGGDISTCLEELESCGFIQHVVTVDRTSEQIRLADPLFAHYIRSKAASVFATK